MENVVVITRSCQRIFRLEQNDNWMLAETDYIDDCILTELYTAEERHLFLVICCTLEEFRDVRQFVSRHKPLFLLYKYLLHGDNCSIQDVNTDEMHVIAGCYQSKLSQTEYTFIIQKIFNDMNYDLQRARDWEKAHTRLIDSFYDQEDLVNIGRALSIEKDQDKLLRMILELSKKITSADAGSIYLIEESDDTKKKQLRFKYSKTFSMEVLLEEFLLDVNKMSIAGYVATTGEVLNIEDVYTLPPDAPYTFNAEIDKQHNYRSKSMLVVPMKNYTGEIIGVIQLLNSKQNLKYQPRTGMEAFEIRLSNPDDFDRYVTVFDEKYNGILEAIAGQAAISIENNRLIHQIENQFEQFVKASVTAIESRDPATSGHSFRVADMCKAMAYAINLERKGEFDSLFFNESKIRELELAALLHDFGKVYIDQTLFGKKKKLYPEELNSLLLRIELLYRYTELEFYKKNLELALQKDTIDDADVKMGLLEDDRNRMLKRIKDIKGKVTLLNEPTVNASDTLATINDIIAFLEQIHVKTSDGNELQVLTEKDITNLKIKRGSLTEKERKEIQSHVDHTYAFVSKIPWPKEYINIPEIALHHHEKLDGSGYPDGLNGRESTSIQSRIMAIADIYDALTSGDRHYKEALSVENSLKILENEANEGRLDKDLVDLFIKYQIYDHNKRHQIVNNKQ